MNRYSAKILDSLDNMIQSLNLCGSTVSFEDTTVYAVFMTKEDAQRFGRELRKIKMVEITLRRRSGVDDWLVSADTL